MWFEFIVAVVIVLITGSLVNWYLRASENRRSFWLSKELGVPDEYQWDGTTSAFYLLILCFLFFVVVLVQEEFSFLNRSLKLNQQPSRSSDRGPGLSSNSNLHLLPNQRTTEALMDRVEDGYFDALEAAESEYCKLNNIGPNDQLEKTWPSKLDQDTKTKVKYQPAFLCSSFRTVLSDEPEPILCAR